MSTLATRIEVRKLARTLGCEPEALDGLEEAGAADLRTLRERLADELLDANRKAFSTIVTLADRLPASVSASVAPRALGPALAARTAALLSPGKAVDLAGRLPASFLAEIARVVDARHIEHIVGELPPDTVVEVTRELRAREEWIVMGGLVSRLSPASLTAAVGMLDDEAMLHTGPLMEDPKRLDEVVEALPDARIEAIVALGAREGAWVELVEMGRMVDPSQRERLVGIVADLPETRLDELQAAASADPELAAALDELANAAPPALRERLAAR